MGYPNASPIFYVEKAPESQSRPKYARAVKNPPLYGLNTKDFERDHRPTRWPSGTEYQYAYCSNYRSLLPPLREQDTEHEVKGHGSAMVTHPPSSHPLYTLHKPTPLPIVDKHYRGAAYHPNDPMGIHVEEELSRRRETKDGPIRLSCREDQENAYTPNYRYEEWHSRPMLEISQEMDVANQLYCRLPEPQSQYWDFYNVVRMGRPPREAQTTPLFQPCRAIPLPMNKDIPNLPPLCADPHLGKFNNYAITPTPFQEGKLCKYVL